MDRRINSGEYWNFRLRQPFPLAPGDLIRSGKLTKKKYREENTRFGRFCDKTIEPELLALPLGGIHVLGAGIARDLSWIKTAVKLKFWVEIFDFSDVAVENANYWLEHQSHLLRVGSHVKVTQTEIMSGWESGKINQEGVVAMYASQFLEHQDDKLDKFLKHFADFLLAQRGRKIYLVLPRLEDNPPDKIKWNSAVLREDREWQVPLLSGFGKNLLKLRVLGTHHYFNRKYTMFEIGA